MVQPKINIRYVPKKGVIADVYERAVLQARKVEKKSTRRQWPRVR